MSKFDELVTLLEYDVRASGQGIPSVPGTGSISTSDPNTIGNVAQLNPYTGTDKFREILKPFSDEGNHHDQGTILPYPLEHTVDKVAQLTVTLSEIAALIKIATDNASLTKPQRHLLETHYKKIVNMGDEINSFVRDLDLLAVPH